MEIKQYTLFGITITASSHEEAMDKFKLKNFTRPASTEAYVEELSFRITNFCEIDVSHYSTITEFVELLIQHGFMKVSPLN